MIAGHNFVKMMVYAFTAGSSTTELSKQLKPNVGGDSHSIHQIA